MTHRVVNAGWSNTNLRMILSSAIAPGGGFNVQNRGWVPGGRFWSRFSLERTRVRSSLPLPPSRPPQTHQYVTQTLGSLFPSPPPPSEPVFKTFHEAHAVSLSG